MSLQYSRREAVLRHTTAPLQMESSVKMRERSPAREEPGGERSPPRKRSPVRRSSWEGLCALRSHVLRFQ